MLRFDYLLAAVALAVAVTPAVPASGRRPADHAPARVVSVWQAQSRPCQHHLAVDAATGAPVGPVTTYGARCIVG
jgi:hypothetical protein